MITRVYDIDEGKYATSIRKVDEGSDRSPLLTRFRADTQFLASTDTEDRAGDIVAQDFDLKDFLANPVILWGHNASIPPVGRALTANVGDDGLMISVEWDEGDPNQLGQLVAHQFREGFLNAGSIGFSAGQRTLRSSLPSDHEHHQDMTGRSPFDSGFLFESNALLEFSAVAIPMNPQALAIRAFADEGNGVLEKLTRYLRETTTRSMQAELLDLIRADPNTRRALRALLLTEGFDSPPPPPKSDTGLTHLFTPDTESEGLDHLWSPK